MSGNRGKADSDRPADADAPEEKLPDFEQALAEVQRIIDQMESGEVSLEQSLDHYGRGMKLIRHCNEVLARAEEQFRKLEPPAAESGGAEASPELEDVGGEGEEPEQW